MAALEKNVAAAAASGWLFALRLLTSRVVDAPDYLGSLGINLIDSNTNYDPAHPAFHARYLALLAALKAAGFCQRAEVVMMYAGYASKSYGDEYIGPHPSGYTGDPAVDYAHVKERLDGWAAACENNTRKVLMGGNSE